MRRGLYEGELIRGLICRGLYVGGGGLTAYGQRNTVIEVKR